MFVEDVEADEMRESLEDFSKRSSIIGSNNWFPSVIVTFFNDKEDASVEMTEPGVPFLKGENIQFFDDFGDQDFPEIIEAISDGNFQALDQVLADYPDSKLRGAASEVVQPE